MAQARDGKMFSGRQAMLSHNRSLPPSGGGGGMKKIDPLAMPGQGGGGDDAGGMEDPATTVAEHGPAVEVNVKHEHEAGKHHVHSSHADGHTTESEHASAEEAHDHGKALSTEGGEPPMGGGDDDGAVYE